VALDEALLDLQRLTERLRRDCPWDREQTAQTIVPHTIEEAYEVADAALAADDDKLLDELGDLLFQVYFLALLLEERGHGDLEQVARVVHDKLVRRHPHVFEKTEGVDTPGKVVEQWEQIKAREQVDAGKKRALLSGIPQSMPALLRAHEIGTRAAAVGFDWANTTDVVDKIEEEVAELREAVAKPEGMQRVEEEMGDLLFAIANLARKLGIEPESALRKANDKFTKRFTALENVFQEQGRSVHEATLEQMEEVWGQVKRE
jgi:nucleoside triphosphate diphosphatase